MKEETYEYLWDYAISCVINGVYAQLDAKTKQAHSVSLNTDCVIKQSVLNSYNQWNQRVKSLFFDSGSDNKNLMDIHKVSACFAAAP